MLARAPIQVPLIITAGSSSARDHSHLFTAHQDFPKPGVLFWSMTKLLANPTAFYDVCKDLANQLAALAPTKIVLVESRGFLWLEVARLLDAGAVLARKASPPKTPPPCFGSGNAKNEYGNAEFHIQTTAIGPNDRVVILDDVRASGGTEAVLASFIEQSFGAKVVAVAVVIEIADLAKSHVAMMHQQRKIPCICAYSAQGSVMTKAKARDPFAYDRLMEGGSMSTAMEQFARYMFPPNSSNAALGVTPADVSRDMRAVLLWHPTMESMAARLLASHPMVLRPSPVQWNTFPDDWLNIKFMDDKGRNPQDVFRGRTLVFLFSMLTPAIITEQLALLTALSRHCDKLLIHLPFFSPGTMERVDMQGDLAAAEPVMGMIRASISASCKCKIFSYDIHATVAQFYGSDHVALQPRDIASVLVPRVLKKLSADGDAYIVFPDEGAYKRFGKNFPTDIKYVYCSKQRGDNDGRAITILNCPSTAPKTALLVDDLVHSGRTLLETVKAMRLQWPDTVFYAYVTHAILEKGGFAKFLETDPATGKRWIEQFFVSDTIPKVTDTLQFTGSPFVVIPASSIATVTLSEETLPVGTHQGTRFDTTKYDLWSASASAVKKQGVQRGLTTRFRNGPENTYTMDAPSGVPDQPVGMDQIRTGAYNRLAEAYRAFLARTVDSFGMDYPNRRPEFGLDSNRPPAGCSLIVAVESGLVEVASPVETTSNSGGTNVVMLGTGISATGATGSITPPNTGVIRGFQGPTGSLTFSNTGVTGVARRRFQDKAFVVCIMVSHAEARQPAVLLPGRWTCATDIPDDVVKALEECNFSRTAGDVMCEKFGWNSKDWHNRVGPLSRLDSIAKAMAEMLNGD